MSLTVKQRRMESLEGRNILITGADTGLGHKMAVSFAAEGMNIGLLGYSESALEEIAADVRSNGVKAIVATADISDINQTYDAIQQVKRECGFIDTLVNNLGPASMGGRPDAKFGWANPSASIATATRGIGYEIRAVLPEMIQNKKGDIVNIILAASQKRNMFEHKQAAAKDELIRISELLMTEMRKYNIRVTSLTPNTMASDFPFELKAVNGNEDYDRETWFEDIAEEVLSQLKMNRYPVIADAAPISMVQY